MGKSMSSALAFILSIIFAYSSNASSMSGAEKKQINVLLLGISGAGKSTAINGLYNLSQNYQAQNFQYAIPQRMHDDRVKEVTIPEFVDLQSERGGSDSEGQTTKWNKYCPLPTDQEGVELCLIDTPGFSDSVTKGNDLALNNIFEAIEKEEVHAIAVVMQNSSIRDHKSKKALKEDLIDNLESRLELSRIEDHLLLIGTHFDGHITIEGLQKNLKKEGLNFASTSFFGFEALRFDHESDDSWNSFESIWDRNKREFSKFLAFVQDLDPIEGKVIRELQEIRSAIINSSTSIHDRQEARKVDTEERARLRLDVEACQKKLDSFHTHKFFVSPGASPQWFFSKLFYSPTPQVCSQILKPWTHTFESDDDQKLQDHIEESEKKLAKKIEAKTPKFLSNPKVKKIIHELAALNKKIIAHNKFIEDENKYMKDKKNQEDLEEKVAKNREDIANLKRERSYLKKIIKLHNKKLDSIEDDDDLAEELEYKKEKAYELLQKKKEEIQTLEFLGAAAELATNFTNVTEPNSFKFMDEETYHKTCDQIEDLEGQLIEIDDFFIAFLSETDFEEQNYDLAFNKAAAKMRVCLCNRPYSEHRVCEEQRGVGNSKESIRLHQEISKQNAFIEGLDAKIADSDQYITKEKESLREHIETYCKKSQSASSRDYCKSLTKDVL